MFNLKSPCINCPVRIDLPPYLTATRLAEIVQASAFQCHKTVDYSGGEGDAGDRPQQCAGVMLLLKRSGQPNAIMQVGERLGQFDPAALNDSAPVYADLWEAITAHDGDPAELLPTWMTKPKV